MTKRRTEAGWLKVEITEADEKRRAKLARGELAPEHEKGLRNALRYGYASPHYIKLWAVRDLTDVGLMKSPSASQYARNKRLKPLKAVVLTRKGRAFARAHVGDDSKKNPHHEEGSAAAVSADPYRNYREGVITEPDEVVEKNYQISGRPPGVTNYIVAVRVGGRWADTHRLGPRGYGVRFWLRPIDVAEAGLDEGIDLLAKAFGPYQFNRVGIPRHIEPLIAARGLSKMQHAAVVADKLLEDGAEVEDVVALQQIQKSAQGRPKKKNPSRTKKKSKRKLSAIMRKALR